MTDRNCGFCALALFQSIEKNRRFVWGQLVVWESALRIFAVRLLVILFKLKFLCVQEGSVWSWMKQNICRVDSLSIHKLLHNLTLLESLLVYRCSTMLAGCKMRCRNGAVSVSKRRSTYLLLLTEAEVLFDLSGLLNELYASRWIWLSIRVFTFSAQDCTFGMRL